MGKAKDIDLRPISSAEGNALIKRVHYSGKVVQNSQLHIGVFYQGKLEGAMQFGPSLDKRKMLGLVEGTKWNEFIELNRLAFTDKLPRNSESRAIAVAMRLLKKHAPHLKWVVSFADATQCGDGTIYRASGFVLTKINSHNEGWVLPNGSTVQACTLRQSGYTDWLRPFIDEGTFNKIRAGSTTSKRIMEHIGAKKLDGHQLRYIYFLDGACRDKLTVPEIPFSRIWELGAGMYRGEKVEAQRV